MESNSIETNGKSNVKDKDRQNLEDKDQIFEITTSSLQWKETVSLSSQTPTRWNQLSRMMNGTTNWVANTLKLNGWRTSEGNPWELGLIPHHLLGKWLESNVSFKLALDQSTNSNSDSKEFLLLQGSDVVQINSAAFSKIKKLWEDNDSEDMDETKVSAVRFSHSIRIAYCEKFQLVAVSAASSHVYILNSTNGQSRFDFDALDEGVSGGILGMFFRITTCELEDSKSKECSELVLIGFDGKMKRVHIPTQNAIHPLNGMTRACLEATESLPLSKHHSICSCFSFNQKESTLAIGGSDGSLSVWKFSSNPPFFRLSFSLPANSATISTVTTQVSFSSDGTKLLRLDLDGNSDIIDLVNNGSIFFSISKSSLLNSEKIMGVAWWSDDKILVVLEQSKKALLIGIDGKQQFGDSFQLPTTFEKLFVLERHQQDSKQRQLIILSYVEQIQQQQQDSKQTKPTIPTNTNPPSALESTASMIVTFLSFGAYELKDNAISLITNHRTATRLFTIDHMESRTPQQSFMSKVESKQFEKALELARKYDLNTNYLYQHWWTTAQVSKETLQDYMKQIDDERWVIHECQQRIPNTYAQNELLLKYGLKLTNTEDSSKLDLDDAREQERCLDRLLFLRYLDLLKTFKKINPDEFSNEEWMKFRETPLLETASEFAASENFDALRILFTYHGDLLRFRLFILNQIPETSDISIYEDLLPSIETSTNENDDESEEKQEQTEATTTPTTPSQVEEMWDEQNWREKEDWVEEDRVLNALTLPSEFDVTLLKRRRNELLMRFPGALDSTSLVRHSHRLDLYCPHAFISSKLESKLTEKKKDIQYPKSAEQISEWYLQRSISIEDNGDVDLAIELIETALQLKNLATDEKLIELLEKLNLYEKVIYDVKRLDVTFRQFERMDNYETFKLLLSDSTAETIVENLGERVSSLLVDLQKPLLSFSSEPTILERYLTERSKEGHLELATKVISSSRPDPNLKHRIIKNLYHLMKITLSTVYASPKTEDWDLVSEIFTCMPVRDLKEQNVSPLYKELQDRIDLFERHLNAAEILFKYQTPRPLSWFFELTSNETDPKRIEELRNESKEIVESLLKQNKFSSKTTTKDFQTLLHDLQELQKNVFTFLSVLEIQKSIFEVSLRNGQIDVAKDLLLKSNNSPQLLESLLNVEKELFNSAATMDDPILKTCKEILDMSPSNASAEHQRIVEEEQNLIKSISLLNDFSYRKVPLQIRLTQDKQTILTQLLQSNSNAYKNLPKFLSLGRLLLNKTSSKLTSRLTLMVANSAYDLSDLESASQISQNLIDSGYSEVWTLASKIGLNDSFSNVSIRQKMLSFAMTQCGEEELVKLLSALESLESKERLQNLKVPNNNNQSSSLMDELLKFRTDYSQFKTNESTLHSNNSNPMIPNKHPFYLTSSPSTFGQFVSSKWFWSIDEKSQHQKINELIFKYYITDKKVGQISDEKEVQELLFSLAQQFLSIDSVLSIGFLLLLNESSFLAFCEQVYEATKSNNDHQQQLRATQFLVYVCSLKISLQSTPTNSTQQQIEQILKQSDSQSLRSSAEKVKSPISDLFKKFDELSEHAADVSVLSKNSNEKVENDKFQADPKYRKEMTLKLVQSRDQNSLKQAIQLSSKQNISTQELLLNHIHFLRSTILTLKANDAQKLIEETEKSDFLNELIEPQKLTISEASFLLDDISQQINLPENNVYALILTLKIRLMISRFILSDPKHSEAELVSKCKKFNQQDQTLSFFLEYTIRVNISIPQPILSITQNKDQFKQFFLQHVNSDAIDVLLSLVDRFGLGTKGDYVNSCILSIFQSSTNILEFSKKWEKYLNMLNEEQLNSFVEQVCFGNSSKPLKDRLQFSVDLYSNRSIENKIKSHLEVCLKLLQSKLLSSTQWKTLFESKGDRKKIESILLEISKELDAHEWLSTLIGIVFDMKNKEEIAGLAVSLYLKSLTNLISASPANQNSSKLELELQILITNFLQTPSISHDDLSQLIDLISSILSSAEEDSNSSSLSKETKAEIVKLMLSDQFSSSFSADQIQLLKKLLSTLEVSQVLGQNLKSEEMPSSLESIDDKRKFLSTTLSKLQPEEDVDGAVKLILSWQQENNNSLLNANQFSLLWFDFYQYLLDNSRLLSLIQMQDRNNINLDENQQIQILEKLSKSFSTPTLQSMTANLMFSKSTDSKLISESLKSISSLKPNFNSSEFELFCKYVVGNGFILECLQLPWISNIFEFLFSNEKITPQQQQPIILTTTFNLSKIIVDAQQPILASSLFVKGKNYSQTSPSTNSFDFGIEMLKMQLRKSLSRAASYSTSQSLKNVSAVEFIELITKALKSLEEIV